MRERKDTTEPTSAADSDLTLGIYLTSACCLELVAGWRGWPQLSGIAASTLGLVLCLAVRAGLRRREHDDS